MVFVEVVGRGRDGEGRDVGVARTRGQKSSPGPRTVGPSVGRVGAPVTRIWLPTKATLENVLSVEL